MDPVVRLDTAEVSVVPGQQAQVTLRVENPSDQVEQYRVEVLPPAAAWCTVHPADLNVYRGSTETVVVVVAPPADGSAPAGEVPFGVRVVSTVDPSRSAVAQGLVVVGLVDGLTLTVKPVESSGRWRARHKVHAANWGNAAVALAIDVVDDNDRLGFLLEDDLLDLPVGASRELDLKVRVRSPMLRGTPQRHAFRVVGRPAPGGTRPSRPVGGTPAPDERVVHAGMTQKPVVTRLVTAAAVLGLAAVVAGVALLLTRPGPAGDDAQSRPRAPWAVDLEPKDVGAMELAWSRVPDVDSYEIVYGRVGAPLAATSTKLVMAGATTDVVMGLDPATAYTFSLVSVAGGVKSEPSESRTETTAPPEDPGEGLTEEQKQAVAAMPSLAPGPTDGPAATSSGAVPSEPSGSGGAGGPAGTSGPPTAPSRVTLTQPWVVLFPVSSESIAEREAAEAEALGGPAPRTAPLRDLPELRRGDVAISNRAGWAVYVEFPTEEDAQRYADDHPGFTVFEVGS